MYHTLQRIEAFLGMLRQGSDLLTAEEIEGDVYGKHLAPGPPYSAAPDNMPLRAECCYHGACSAYSCHDQTPV